MTMKVLTGSRLEFAMPPAQLLFSKVQQEGCGRHSQDLVVLRGMRIDSLISHSLHVTASALDTVHVRQV